MRHTTATPTASLSLERNVTTASDNEQIRSRVFLACVVGLSALGWVTRCLWIGKQSLWYDEAGSVALAVQPLQLLYRSAALDIHPPLYFVILHVWMLAAGDSEAALRLCSAVAGTLAIPALAILGRRLAGEAVGVVAASATAVSPMLVYYGQETRMYALLALLSTLTAYALFRAVHGEWRWWPISSLLMACVLWTHLYGALLFVALNAWAALFYLVHWRAPMPARATVGCLLPSTAALAPTFGARVHHVRRDILAWSEAQLFTIALFAPWIPVAWEKLHAYASPDHGGTFGWIMALAHQVWGRPRVV